MLPWQVSKWVQRLQTTSTHSTLNLVCQPRVNETWNVSVTRTHILGNSFVVAGTTNFKPSSTVTVESGASLVCGGQATSSVCRTLYTRTYIDRTL
jgi:hypothetical protein